MHTLKIGRSSTNDLVIDSDQSVSRQHAVVTVDNDGSATIRDLNSTSGTYVDGRRITTDTPLNHKSAIRLGNTTLTLSQILSTRKRSTPSPTVQPDLSDRITVGRGPSNNIVISSPDVSTRHCVIGKDASGRIVIVDAGSSNGTFVNGTRISSPTRLNPGDRVTLASNSILDWERHTANKHRPTKTITIMAAAIAAIITMGLVVWKFMDRPWSPEDIYSHYRTSVVLIQNVNSYTVKLHGHTPSDISSTLAVLDNVHVNSKGEVMSGPSGCSGTGFFISNDGKIMTNKHVLYPMGADAKKEPETIKAAVRDMLYALARQTGEPAYMELASDIDVEYTFDFVGVARNDTHVSSTDDFLKATPLRCSQDDEVDVAILQLNSKTTPEDAVIVDLKNFSDPSRRRIGSKVFTIGFPQSFTLGNTSVGLEANNQSGEITQDRGENVYGHNITIHQGASGSPVFDDHGKFAGIIVSGFLGLSQGYNHAIQPEKAYEFIK